LSPVDVVDAVHKAIDRDDAAIHSFNTVIRDRAMAEALRAARELRAGTDRGPLHGVPFAAKDNYDSADVLTTCQSHVLAANVPASSAFAIKRLEDAGAILVGKCGTAEFATGGPSNELLFPPARNPWDLARYTGGSSTGSAAAVAAGFVRIALGSDTGGSIRGPAACCGVVGLKPTYGLVSRRGIFPLSWTLDHAGPLAASVEDAAHALQAMAGYDDRDPASADRPDADYLGRLRAGVAGLRIGYIRRWPRGHPDLHPKALALFDHGANTLGVLGAVVEEIDFPDEAIFLAVGRTIMAAELYAVHRRWLADGSRAYAARARERMVVGSFVRASDYIDALRLRRQLAIALNRDVLARHDALVTSTVVRPAWRFDELPDAPMHMLGYTTYAFNVTGNPALSVPCGLVDGLPIGMQIIGRAFDEATVLRIGVALETAAIGVERSRLAPASGAANGSIPEPS
jgi:aspartyl-tRNA(Asn)/glutamyl-tRNA(Gln) amidotransferase subunit A